jgi:subfamily B ATP-binding cassette protein MsbA
MNGRLTLGSFLAFNSYLRFLFDPSRNLVSLNSTFQQSLAALERVYQIFDEEPEPEKGCVDAPASVRGKIEFRDVSFSYDGKVAALSGLSFVVEPGKTAGIVGPSGSGKSTIIKLLLRYYQPDRGEILLDDINIQELPLGWLRGQIATVFQQTFLFGEDVLSNVLIGRQSASMQDVVSCCRMAGAHEFVEDLPDKYSAPVGERGVALSGGQIQRLSIARALLKRAPVLVLDEATAALDATSEKLFREALSKQERSATALIIAHRLSTVRYADLILVIEAGTVIEAGRHEDLMTIGGCYQTLYEDYSRNLERLPRAV